MKTYVAEETAVINAPPAIVYGIISDYHDGHQAILPRKYFDEMIVTQGGTGTGTEITVRMTVMGVSAEYQMVVSEPNPGRVLVEADIDADVVTTFTVEPAQNGTHSRVTISTQMPIKPGLQGWIEKHMNPPIMRRIYREELSNLASVAQARLQPARSL